MTGEHILRMLRHATGLDLSLESVESAVRKRMKQRHMREISSYEAEAARNREELDALIDLVVVPESWFFRDAEAFSVAAQFALDRHAATGGPVRILSAPCASGEEPYSLAIALHSAGMRQDSFVIDAIDVSPQVIRRAQKGHYWRNAFRTADLGFREQHFIQHGDNFELAPDVRRLVRFRCDNLLTFDPPDGKTYDIIFCRNLLIYFNEETQAAALRKLRTLLDDEGLLFCGYAETTTFCLNDFSRAPYANAFAVQKKRRTVASQKPITGAPFQHRRAWPVTGTPTLPRPAAVLQPENRSAAAEKEDPDALFRRARQAADVGGLEEAAQACRAYLGLVPDSAEAHFMLGLLSEKHEDDKEAVEFLRRAIYLDPNHYEALCHLALLAERQGDMTKAQAYRQRAARVFGRRSGEREQ
ncbi:CheR family methyltransferase [Noviherbaspirillum sp. ST9]|uniref:CheR family methyltransferase n=1 Tax=Noviherbaspirillum sp. ST9 TaxID=3401606 RepID=UPI003B589863